MEDDETDRRRIVGALQRWGYQVDGAATEAEALRRVCAGRYDAVVMDLILPDGTGLNVLHTLRTDGPHPSVPVIVASIVPQDEVAWAHPVQGYLEKPVDLPRLRQALGDAGLGPASRGHALVVDEDQQAVRLLTRALGRRESMACPSGDEARAAVQERTPALVILDPVARGGLAFLSRLRGVPVVVWTRRDVSGPEMRRLRRAAAQVVSKDLSSLHGILDAVLVEGRRPARPVADPA